ncbi:MAG: DUF3147 family protein [Candidatus Altiarchaeota archaeon]
MDYRKFAIDFIIGGMMVAGAVTVGVLVNPALGGIMAGAPLRLASTIFLTGMHEGDKLAYEMAKGSLYAVLGTLLFSLSLVYLMPKVGLTRSFVLSTTVWMIATIGLYSIGKAVLR